MPTYRLKFPVFPLMMRLNAALVAPTLWCDGELVRQYATTHDPCSDSTIVWVEGEAVGRVANKHLVEWACGGEDPPLLPMCQVQGNQSRSP
jgi:hypothetical protein